MKVRVDSEAPHADYQGKPYYFCSSMCRDSFAKAPEKYSSGKSSPAMN
jgi:YHS domain-containing protein